MPMSSPTSLKRTFDEAGLEQTQDRSDTVPIQQEHQMQKDMLAHPTSSTHQLPVSPPTPVSSNNIIDKPEKKPKLTFAEKQSKEFERQLRAQQKNDELAKKQEERQRREQEKADREVERLKKADEKKTKDEERRKAKEERDRLKEEEKTKKQEEIAKKEAEKQKKEEEKSKKERVGFLSPTSK